MTPDTQSARPSAMLLSLILVALGVAACGNGDARMSQEAPGVARTESKGLILDDAMKRRHADEAAALVDEARVHIASMKTAGPAERRKRTGAHADIVVRLTSTVDRQMRERDMNMNMADERNGETMGITGAEYRSMREQLRALQREAQALRTADDADVRQRMSPHLDQLEGFVAMVEKTAAHLRN